MRNKKLLLEAAQKFYEVWPVDKFDMRYFVNNSGSLIAKIEDTKIPFCGTSCCFAGAMPWLGIEALDVIEDDCNEYGDVYLRKYIYRLFGISEFVEREIWDKIFSFTHPNCKEDLLRRVKEVCNK